MGWNTVALKKIGVDCHNSLRKGPTGPSLLVKVTIYTMNWAQTCRPFSSSSECCNLILSIQGNINNTLFSPNVIAVFYFVMFVVACGDPTDSDSDNVPNECGE